MIWHKLILVRNGQIITTQYIHPSFAEELQKIKCFTYKKIEKIGYVIIFIILKFFIKSFNFIKIKSIIIIKKLKNKFKKENKSSNKIIEKNKTSKYLKTIEEYRKKIKIMKYRIKKEEGIE